MKYKYTDILLVETEDASIFVVEAPASMISIGNLVKFDEGRIGTVRHRAWIGDDPELYELICSVAEVYELEEACRSFWEKEAADGEISGDS